ncbi:hypothetical protein YC2023_101888 [Brassica napus]
MLCEYTFEDRNKFSSRACACLFLGYPVGYKGYKVMDLDTNSISITRNVVFHEHVFPYQSDYVSPSDFFSHLILPSSTPYVPTTVSDVYSSPSHHDNPSTSHTTSVPASLSSSIPSTIHTTSAPASLSSSHSTSSPAFLSSSILSSSHTTTVPASLSSSIPSSSHNTSASSFASSSHNASSSTSPSPVPLVSETVDPVVSKPSLPDVRPKRNTKAPTYLSDYHCALLQTLPPLPPNHKTPYPIIIVLFFNSKSHLSIYGHTNREPKTIPNQNSQMIKR